MPPKLAACLSRDKFSTLTPMARDIFAISSVALSERLMKIPIPARPANDTKPVFKLNTALRVEFKPRPMALNAFLVRFFNLIV